MHGLPFEVHGCDKPVVDGCQIFFLPREATDAFRVVYTLDAALKKAASVSKSLQVSEGAEMPPSFFLERYVQEFFGFKPGVLQHIGQGPFQHRVLYWSEF